MAHNIHRMVFAGETPWHRIGTQLPRNGTWEEIREAAGFYEAEARPVFLADGTRIPDRKALVRKDSGAYLATVGTGYEILQFAELAEAGVKASGDVQAIWHTAGTLGENGVRGWLLAELPNPIRVRGDVSEIRKYVLLTTAHDALRSAILMNAATRVVCQNTLGAALAEKDGARWSIRHTRNAKQRLESAAKSFRNIATNYEKFGQLANHLAGLRFSDAQYRATVAKVIEIPDDGKDHDRLNAQREQLGRLWETFAGHENLRGTAWGAFQAFTEYADHHRATRTPDTGAALLSATLGSGATLKANALTAILDELRAPAAAVAA